MSLNLARRACLQEPFGLGPFSPLKTNLLLSEHLIWGAHLQSAEWIRRHDSLPCCIIFRTWSVMFVDAYGPA